MDKIDVSTFFMKKKSIQELLDFIPLVILTISAGILIWKVATTETGFHWKHVVGLIVLPLNYLVFAWRHKAGVLMLGLTLFFGFG